MIEYIACLRRETRIQMSKRKKSSEIVKITFILIPQEIIKFWKNMMDNPSILIGKEGKNRSERLKKYINKKN